MKKFFDKEFFKRNRNMLRRVVGDELIVVSANGVLQRNNDVTYKFRQDSNFWYLTGIEHPDVLLVMKGDDEFLIIPEQDESIKKFDGAIDTKKLTDRSAVEKIFDEESGWQAVKSYLRSASQVYVPQAPQAYIDRHAIYTNPARKRAWDRIAAAKSDVKCVDIRQELAALRSIKQPKEIAAIQHAIDITSEALSQIYAKRSKYRYEYEIEAAITAAFVGNGFGHAFLPIVASGKNACTIHYIENSKALEKNGLLVLDIGAEVSNYAADITRTYAVSNATKRQQQVHEAVLNVQRFAMSLLKPGVMLRDYESKVEQYMGEQLEGLGLIKERNKESIRRYYPHSTSHFLGLDTHDVGLYDKPLKENTIITCEPGIYIPEEGIGVRIEDDILITSKGFKNLSQKLPTGL